MGGPFGVCASPAGCCGPVVSYFHGSLPALALDRVGGFLRTPGGPCVRISGQEGARRGAGRCWSSRAHFWICSVQSVAGNTVPSPGLSPPDPRGSLPLTEEALANTWVGKVEEENFTMAGRSREQGTCALSCCLQSGCWKSTLKEPHQSFSPRFCGR